MSKDLGKSTSYAYYVAEGGTKTPQEYGEMLVNIDTVATRAEDAADSAAESATGALNSKNAAQTAATTATNKATEATTAATTATTKAGEASTSASTATSAKDTAVSASQTATSKATEATTAAATATSAATTATTAKDDAVSAKTAAQTAQTGAETAAASVEASAEQIATNAEDISQLKSKFTVFADGVRIKHSQAVTKDAYSVYTFSNPVPQGNYIRIINISASTVFSVNLMKADGTTQNVSAGIATGKQIIVEAPFDVIGIRCYCNNTQWAFIAEYGENVSGKTKENSELISDSICCNSINILSKVTWEIGSIDGTGGGPMGSATRLRTDDFIDLSIFDTLRFTVNSGYQFVIDWYDENNNIVQVNESGNWLTRSQVYTSWGTAKKIKVLVSDVNSGNVTLDYANQLTAFGSIKIVDVLNNTSDASVINANNTDLGFVIGTLVSGSGSEDTTVSRIRSNYVRLGKGSVIRLNHTRVNCMIVYEFDSNKKYVSDSAWNDGNVYVMQNDGYARVLIRKTRYDGTISSDEVDGLAEELTIYRHIPQSLVETIADKAVTIPSYFESQVSTALESINSNIISTGINGDSFAFITDLHWQSNAKNSPKLMKTIVDGSNVGKVICGGDLIGGGTKSTQVALMDSCVKSFDSIPRFYVLFGNHDSNTIGTSVSDRLTKSEVYGINQKHTDFVMDYGAPCYFSFDNPTTKTRYICLDTGLEGHGLDTTQRDWLNATLTSMPTGYHALVFAHIIYQTTTTWHVGLQPSELQITSFMSAVSDILDAFNTNNSDKKVEAIFGGHVHIDCNFSTTGGIPIVLTDCDSRQTYTETSTGSGTANHALGTVDEQCFDVVTIDYTAKTIKCVRIGRGADRTITY